MTKYTGTFEGSRYESLYPNLYRVTYESTSGYRAPQEYTVIRCAMSESHAIESILRRSDVTRYPRVELIHTLQVDA